MATYQEIRSRFSDDDLRHRVETAVVIAAEAELVASPGSVNGRSWGLKALQDTAGWGRKAFILVLAANKDASVAAISGASDTAIQSAVNAVKDGLIAAEAGE